MGESIRTHLELANAVRSLRVEQFETLAANGADCWVLEQPANSMCYTPPGFVLCEKPLSGKHNIGIRTCAMATKVRRIDYRSSRMILFVASHFPFANAFPQIEAHAWHEL